MEVKALLESHVWMLVQRKETDAFKEEACAIEWKTKTRLDLDDRVESEAMLW
jgi:hypothetical protein